MQQVEMRGQARRGDGASHGEAIFEQRPIERFAVEGDEYGAVGNAGCEFVKQGMLFGKVTHKELLDLQSTGIPPRQADEKSVRAGAPGEARRFRVEEKRSEERRVGKECRSRWSPY